MSDTDAASSSTETTNDPVENVSVVEKMEEFAEPDAKRRKISTTTSKSPEEKRYKLEERLGGILCCAVCLDLPRAAVYQCLNGHLMCAGCFTHLLADARLRDETATCPNCRIEISKASATRNLAVENAVSELPSECQYCGKQFPRNSLERHEETQCEERLTGCKYSRIGCPWRGPLHESGQHESECVHPNRTGAEVMDALQVMDQKLADERTLYDNIFDLLAYEKITFNDLQLKPYRTDEFVHRLFYETSRFSAFNHQWVVKARINNSQKDPTQSSERDMTYQLIQKTKATTTLTIYYIILKGPFGDMKIQPRIYKHDFSELENEGPYMPLSLPDTAECNRLLAAKTINFRFHHLLYMNGKFKTSNLRTTKSIEDCIIKNKSNCALHTGENYDLAIPYFCGQDSRCGSLNDQWALERAKANVERYYSVVGILEEVNTTLEVFEHRLPYFFKGAQNLYYRDLLQPYHNNRGRLPKASDDFRKHIKATLSKEYEFYEWIKTRLFGQLQILRGEHTGH